jgi:hypothetical protein
MNCAPHTEQRSAAHHHFSSILSQGASQLVSRTAHTRDSTHNICARSGTLIYDPAATNSRMLSPTTKRMIFTLIFTFKAIVHIEALFVQNISPRLEICKNWRHTFGVFPSFVLLKCKKFQVSKIIFLNFLIKA